MPTATITLPTPHVAKVPRAVADAFAELTDQLTSLRERHYALSSRYEELRARHEALVASNRAAVKRRVSIELRAARVLRDAFDDQLSDRDLMIAAILAVDPTKDGSAIERKGDDYVLGIFDMHVPPPEAARKTKLEIVREPRGAG